jgi:hypothetical protein
MDPLLTDLEVPELLTCVSIPAIPENSNISTSGATAAELKFTVIIGDSAEGIVA